MKKLLSIIGIAAISAMGIFLFAGQAYAAGIVTSATGGTDISVDDFGTSTYTPLTGPTLTCGALDDLAAGTIVITAPTGFSFNTGQDVTAAPSNEVDLGGGAAAAVTATPAADTITFTVTTGNTTNAGATIVFSNIEVIPSAGTPTASGELSITFAAGTFGDDTEAGSLSSTAGTLENFSVVAPATILTAQNMATTITARDQYNNTTTVGIADTIVLTADGGSTVYPASIAQAQFTDDGVWTGNLLLDKAGTITLTATRGAFVGTDSITVTENKIANLTCESSGQAGAIWLRWTEPAQTYAGLFTGYIAKHYTAALDDANFGSGTVIAQTWSPVATQGVSVQRLVTGLNPGTRYYFGITLGKSGDTVESIVSTPSATCIAPASAAANIDATAPNTQITTPATSSTVQAGQALKITGTAIDAGGSSVQKIEVSLDGGSTWNQATVTSDDGANLIWEYTWANAQAGSVTIKARATDWVGNIETTPAEITVTVSSTGAPATETTTTTTTTTETTGTGTVAQLQAQLQVLRTQLLSLLMQLLAQLQAQLSAM